MNLRSGLSAAIFALAAGAVLPLHADVTVAFVERDRYGDAGDRPADLDRNLERLQSFLVAAAEPCLDADEGLAFSVLDVDLAGRYEWWHHPSGVRIMRDIDWPRMKVEYRHVDADGETIAEGREWLSDMDYLRRGTRRPTDRRSLRYERAMIERWVERTFCSD